LTNAEIEARHVWKPMHLQPVYAGHRAAVTGVAERLFDRGVVLPSGSVLRDGDIDRVLEVLHEVLG
jgi:dTDP-4-amino-4,6-dideoxygalactose transaminase